MPCSIGDIFKLTRDISFFDIMSIASHVLKMRTEEVIANHNRILREEEEKGIFQLIDERRKGKPIPYITCKREFFSEEFFVDERVLIPRPETELIIEEAREIIKKMKGPLLILDMGCGSGAIGITLSKMGNCKVLMVDISYGATQVAKANALCHAVKDKVGIICSDLFQGIKEKSPFDMVLANMPYVSKEEWHNLPKDVRDFEPEIALNGGTDGLDVYRRLIPSLPFYLKRDGVFICEIGSKDQALYIGEALEGIGFDYIIKKDLSGRERIVKATWKNS
ncbi:MAG: peptide chain release factor N(5)-glutamine methyltransferase [Syntrophorhabdaceae bacterium]|nr:peptide chain release factor N(5)-glutamine methyltransferase [Syntrophorhabdaceae bacterium]